MEKTDLEFASLLHDIGKFYQRTGHEHDSVYKKYSTDDFGFTGAHAKWSADFISHYWNENIVDLALYHHKPTKSKNKKLCDIVQIADHHSSAERVSRGDNEKGEVLKSLLISIFSEISIEGNKIIDEMYVPLKELKLNKNASTDIKTMNFNILKPISKEKMSGYNLRSEYKQLWDKFIKEMKTLSIYDFNTILALLKKYTSTIPSSAYVDNGDISLYDHSKTTSALATCRYLFSKDSKLKKTINQNVYLAINGDISGIQNFIFKVSSPKEAQSGMSKRLRGRSLYLTLLCDAIADYIADALNLTKANILFCGGGRFTIIAPNTIDTKNKLNEIKNMINKKFIEKFNAELYFALVYNECSGEDLEEFGDITVKLSNKLAEDKKHKFIDNLDEVFDFDKEVKYQDLCSVCGKPYDKKGEKNICPDCKDNEELGQHVANADYMIKIYSKENIDKFKKYTSFDLLNIAYLFRKESKFLVDDIKKLAKNADRIEVVKLNDTDFLDLESEFDLDIRDKLSFSFGFLGNVVPNLGKYSDTTHPDMPLYFEHLAKISKGSNKLGLLKMDVDNLGRIFSEGFKNESNVNKRNIGKPSISRISTLSSQLDMFFSGVINDIASNYKAYTNLSDESLIEKFDDFELEIQNDSDDTVKETFTIYRKKSDACLSSSEKKSLEKYEIPTIHINYSGGDDLLVLGPYDDIISFAGELREKFKIWTCNNPSINLSAGINIISPKFPIGKAAIIAEDYLESSKSCGRNKITVFGETVNWDNDGKFKGFNDLYEFGCKLESYYNEKYISKSFVYSLLNLWKNNYDYKGLFSDSEKWDEDRYKRINTRRFVPLFKYKLRLIKNNEIKEDLDKSGLKFMPWIKIPASWFSLRMR